MTTTKNLGIWMDHSNAHLTELTVDPITTTTVTSKFTHQVMEQSLHKSEHVMHNKQNHQQHEFYKHLSEVIKHYESIILFGPTDAKNELFNLLKADHRFAKIQLKVSQADKMTEQEQQSFVKDYFSKH